MRVWLRAMRAPFFTASFIPVSLGAAVAWYEGHPFSPLLYLVCLLGIVACHGGTNMANDYYDHLTRDDWVNQFRSPFNGGAGLIQEGILTPGTVLRAAAAMYAVALACGAYLAWRCGWAVAAMAAVGFVSAFFYTAGPLRLSYVGWGELLVGLNFGPLVVLGSHYVQSGRLSPLALVAALPVGFLIAAVLYINQFPDIAADAEVGKRNWVVRLGTARALPVYYAMLGASYAAVAAGVAAGLLPTPTLAALLTLPLAWRAAANARANHADPRRMVPSCALTVNVHLFTGLLLLCGIVCGGALWGPRPL